VRVCGSPYSDASYAVVSGEHYSRVVGPNCAPIRLRPLQLLAHTYKYTTDFITVLLLHITLVCWVGVLSSNNWPFAITFSKNGGWAYFRYEATVYVLRSLKLYRFKGGSLVLPIHPLNWTYRC